VWQGRRISNTISVTTGIGFSTILTGSAFHVRQYFGYYRFSLSLHDMENILAERGIGISHETIRFWVRKI